MRAVKIETRAENKGHYVPGMISKGMLYVSGQLPMDHETGKLEQGDITAQTARALHNVELVLRAAGTDKSRVVLCRIYIPDVSGWDAVNEAYAAFFGEHKPARCIVPTRPLHHGALVEIEAVAEMPEEE